jgi:hypothetical protein
MTSNADVAKRWAEVVTGRATRHLKGRSVIANGNVIYSYGRHFPMAEAYRTRAGELWVLVNGDRYSVTTSGHQSMVRMVVARLRVPSIIVPFSALEAAGIIRSSIELVEVTPDSNLEHHHQSLSIEDVPRGDRERWGSGEYRQIEPDADGFYRWTRYEHRLGEAVFSAEYRRRRESARRCLGPFDRSPGWASDFTVCSHGMRGSHRPQVVDQGRATFLSGFDHQERPPLYFLAQLPREAVAA